MLFTFGCKQKPTDNTGKQNNPEQTTTASKITITVKGGAGLEIKKPESFKYKKGSSWKDIKTTATLKIKLKANQEITEWRINDDKGQVIKDADKFDKDTIVFAVHTERTNKESINLTIEADEGYTFKDATKPCKIKIEKDAKWANVKELTKEKVNIKVEYVETGWHLSNKDGQLLDDNHVFTTDATIYATSKKSDITITVAGDDGINLAETKAFGAKKGATWKDIKAQAEAIATAKDDFVIQEWHKTNEMGALLTEATKFEESATVFAKTKRKVVNYKVEHHQENADDDGFTKFEEETKTGEAGRNSDAKAKSYPGFDAQSFEQSAIKADGTTVITIKYKRMIVSLAINLNGGETTTQLEDEGSKKRLKGKFDAKVHIETPTKAGASFLGWTPTLPAKFPLNDTKTYTAAWKKTGTSYRLSIEGDERLEVSYPQYIDISATSPKTFGEVKDQIKAKLNLKSGWSATCYEIYDFRLSDEMGSKLEDSKQITDDITVYARTNYTKFKWEGTSITGLDEQYEKPRGRIIIPARCTEIRNFAFVNNQFSSLGNWDEITDIDMRDASELLVVALYELPITSIDLSSCTKLKEVDLTDCKKLETVKLTGCTELIKVNLSRTAITSIDLSSCTKLKEVDLYQCTKLETVNLAGCTELTKVNLSGTAITSIDLSSCTKLKEVLFQWCKKLKNVDLTPCNELTEFSAQAFMYAIRAEVKLPSSITSMVKYTFGLSEDSWCKKVLVPNDQVAKLVKDSGYPEVRIERYQP